MKLVFKSLLLLCVLFVVVKQAFADGGEPATTDSDVATLQEPFTFKFKNNVTLKLYGKAEMLTYYDTTSPFVSDWLVFVYPETNYDGTEDSFSMAVRSSLFGFKFNMPDIWGAVDLNSAIEMDFVGGFSTGTSTAYSPLMRLKQAWFSLGSDHYEFLAGQHLGVIGPLSPDACPWVGGGTWGNPWIRLPQLRFTAKDDHWKFELSANRPMGANEVLGSSQDDLISDGEQSNLPIMMSRLGFTGKLGSVGVTTGISGVYGREKVYRNSATEVVDEFETIWMGVYDLLLSSKYLDFKGEAFMGSNINTFYGGVMQGILISDTNADGISDTVNSVAARGGWAQLTLKPWTKVYFNLGGGIDDPDNTDLAVTGRAYNFFSYANVNYKPNKWLQFSAEPSFMRTGYNDDTYNDNIRGLLRTTFMY